MTEIDDIRRLRSGIEILASLEWLSGKAGHGISPDAPNGEAGERVL